MEEDEQKDAGPAPKPPGGTAEAIMTQATTLEFLRPTLNNPDPKTLANEILKSLNYRIGKNPAFATQHDWLTAVTSVVRDRIVERWLEAPRPPTTRRPSASIISRWSS